MDGTLLQSNGKMSEFTKEKLNNFYKKGIPFSVATARSMVSAMPILDGVHFAAPIVLMNGVFVYDTETKKAVFNFVCGMLRRNYAAPGDRIRPAQAHPTSGAEARSHRDTATKHRCSGGTRSADVWRSAA